MRPNQVLPVSRKDCETRSIATVVAYILIPAAIATLIWVALAAGLPFMLGTGALYFAVSSTWLWYHIFQLHRPAKYCVNRNPIEPRAENGVVNRDAVPPTAERERSFKTRLAHDHDALLAVRP